MRRKIVGGFAVVAMVAAALTLAGAETANMPELRPGLWEFTLSGQGDGAKRRLCLTPEMAKDLKTLAATSDPASDCKVSNEHVTGKTRTFDLACTRPRKYRATIAITVHGPDYFVTVQDYVAWPNGRETHGRVSVTYRRVGACR